MARIRTIKPEFFRSPDIAQLDFPIRIFYQALWCWADDFGIGETNLNGLLGFAFPDEDNFTAQDLRRFCAEVARTLRVEFYTVRGRHYYAIPSWEKHQKLERRTERRKHPGPDDPDATPDQRIYGCADSAPTIRRGIGAESGEMRAGTGEQGNRGTGEVRTPVRTEPHSAPEPTAAQSATPGAELVRQIIPKGHPPATLTSLRLQASELLNTGTDRRIVADALRLWLDKPGIGNGRTILASLASEVIKSRTTPHRTNGSRIAASDAAFAQAQALKSKPAERLELE